MHVSRTQENHHQGLCFSAVSIGTYIGTHMHAPSHMYKNVHINTQTTTNTLTMSIAGAYAHALIHTDNCSPQFYVLVTADDILAF